MQWLGRGEIGYSTLELLAKSPHHLVSGTWPPLLHSIASFAPAPAQAAYTETDPNADTSLIIRELHTTDDNDFNSRDESVPVGMCACTQSQDADGEASRDKKTYADETDSAPAWLRLRGASEEGRRRRASRDKKMLR